MKNVLMLVEKPSHVDLFKKSLPGIAVMPIGGYAYREEDKKYMVVSEEDLEEGVHLNYRNKEGLEEPVVILGSDYLNRNCIKILDYLHHNKVDTIVNACDYDQSGDYLFKYAVEDVMNLDPEKYCFKRFVSLDLTSESISKAYQQLVNQEAVELEDVER